MFIRVIILSPCDVHRVVNAPNATLI